MTGPEGAEITTYPQVRYDQAADAAYISFQPIGSGNRAGGKELTIPGTSISLYFDLDNRGQIMGIEVLRASRILPESVLKSDGSNPTIPKK